MVKINRNFKASVFTHLFSDPDNERGLYNAFSIEQCSSDIPVIDYTLNDALYKDRVNDLAFTVGGKLVCFFEGQSTINENMALRLLIYCGRVYEKLIHNKAMYTEKRISIPTPVFYVLYTGVEPFPVKKIYKLSDSYLVTPEGEQPLELVVTAYNMNKGYNKEIAIKDSNLYGYITFLAKVRKNEQDGMERAKAVELAIKECIREGILATYLENNASEVFNMLFQEWNWDDAKAVWSEEAAIQERNLWQSVVADKDAAYTVALSEKDAMLADNAAMLADKDAILADNAAEIAALKAQLSKYV